MIVAGDRADLLPSSGFWYRMAKADVFDLDIYGRFEPRGFQRRILMRGEWASIPVVTSRPCSRISDVRILPQETPRALCELVHAHYRDARHWGRYGERVLALIEGIQTEYLWQFNLDLILGMRELLDIGTPVSIARPRLGRSGADMARTLRSYGASTYLCAQAGRAYMDGCEDFTEAGIEVRWSEHRPVTMDSVLSILMDCDDPMAVIMSEHKLSNQSPA
jgi:hypothetical protein